MCGLASELFVFSATLSSELGHQLPVPGSTVMNGQSSFACLIVIFGSSFALASSGGGGGSNSRYDGPDYSDNYSSSNSSSFRAPPSNYTWSVPAPTTMPSRSVPASLLPTMIGSLPSSTTAPDCSGQSFANIYAGLCSTTNTSIPYVGTLALGSYEGVRCQSGTYEFTQHYTDGSGTVGQKFVLADLPDANQYPAASGTAVIQCTSLKELGTGVAYSIAGKVLKGTTTFQCIAGEWRLSEMSCNDAPAVCPAQTFSVNWSGYAINAPLISSTQGQVQTADCTTALGAPPPGTSWSGPGFSFLCGATGTRSVQSGTCTAVTIVNLVYPNCAGGTMVGGYYTYGLGGAMEQVCLDGGGVCQWDQYSPGGGYYINPLTGAYTSGGTPANVGCAGYNSYMGGGGMITN